MADRFGLKRCIATLTLTLVLAGDAAAQHPLLGPGHPAPDPRSAAAHGLQGSVDRAVEFANRQGVESCAFRAIGLRRPGRQLIVDEWALGVERYDGKTTLFFEVRVIDTTGTVLAIERPTLYMFGSGPTYDWRPGRPSREGYVRVTKDLKEATPGERLGFKTAVEERGIRELAITLPNGRGDAYIALYNGATPRQFEFFGDCVCRLLDNERNELFRCP